MNITDKLLCKKYSYHQSAAALWKLWTTHEGLKTFFGADNRIELIPGGAFEIYFHTDAPAGLKGSEGCKVLSYLPEKHMSFSWNAPPQFEYVRNADYKTWVVVEFQPLSATQAALTLTHLGWPNDERWSPVYDYFDRAWDIVLANLSALSPEPATGLPVKKVTGIGGIFFKSRNPEALKEWYKTHLGLDTDEYGTNFEWRQGADPSSYGFTQWSPFDENTDYFNPSSREFMINYRVEHIEQLMETLKQNGVQFTDEMETYDYGKFIHILDMEGNKIELWEPNDVAYDTIVQGRTK
jgi:uncharacterized protein YndB with AHSA1/START domain/predicted enzyme related to lactoylglutathione lyase